MIICEPAIFGEDLLSADERVYGTANLCITCDTPSQTPEAQTSNEMAEARHTPQVVAELVAQKHLS